MRRSPVAILLLLAFLSLFWFPALAAAAEPVLVSDDFSSLNPAWDPADDVMSVAKGKLTLILKENGAYRTDGYVGVTRNTRCKGLPVVPNRVRPEINQGLDAVNKLCVVTSGKALKLYLNDKLMDEFESAPPKNGSLIGFYGESGEEPCTYEFSDLSVGKHQP